MTRIISWNLLHNEGAALADVLRLARHTAPDLLLLQEATREMDALADYLGGTYHRAPLPGRRHGLAFWSPHRLPKPQILALPSGPVVQRVCQLIALNSLTIANVHLSHGQLLNRLQLRHIASRLPHHAAILGDFNLVGPCLLPGFVDAGPRVPTHRCADMLPLRLDRCLTRNLTTSQTARLDPHNSDHHPIQVHLHAAPLRLAA